MEVSKVFGIWKSTVIKIVQVVTYELVVLSCSFIRFPQIILEHATAKKPFSKFLNRKIPQVVRHFLYDYDSTKTYETKKLPGNEKKQKQKQKNKYNSKVDCFNGKKSLFLLSKLNLAFNNCFPVIFRLFSASCFLALEF